MSVPCSIFRSAPRNVSKLRSISLSYSACPVSLKPGEPGIKTSRGLATVNPEPKTLPDVWFTGSSPRRGFSPSDNGQPPDERKLKLGKTLRILQERLPTLLQSPLPPELLSPHIKLHLFPSTHPHLPTVSGRVAYSAALWTSPIAWGRMPLVGNVKLEILSERMIKSPTTSLSGSTPTEQLIVRWRTIGKTRGRGTGALYKGRSASDNMDKITEWLGGGKGEDDSKEFTGLFIFEFDEEGRVVSHTIEHVQEGGNWEKGVGARVVGLTDWLLGGMRNGHGEGTPCPAFWGAGSERDDRRRR